MKKEWATKWIKALRSGKYKQAKKCLRKDNAYCCLGVLTKLLNPKHEDLKGDLRSKGLELPEDVMEITGVTSGKGKCDFTIVSTWQPDLARYNDNGYSFKEIADIIEKNWRKL
jgi:hypothetical protein